MNEKGRNFVKMASDNIMKKEYNSCLEPNLYPYEIYFGSPYGPKQHSTNSMLRKSGYFALIHVPFDFSDSKVSVQFERNHTGGKSTINVLIWIK